MGRPNKGGGTLVDSSKADKDVTGDSSGWEKLTVDSAITYLKEVEQSLPQVQFCEFLEIIDDFKHARISTKTVAAKVRCIFEGKSTKLIQGFNMFLPPEFHLRPEKFSIAMELVKKIRERFERKQPKLLLSFVEILNLFQSDGISLEDARAKVKSLFEAHPDIISDFDAFLPTTVSLPDDHLPDDDGSDALSDVSASSHKYEDNPPASTEDIPARSPPSSAPRPAAPSPPTPTRSPPSAASRPPHPGHPPKAHPASSSSSPAPLKPAKPSAKPAKPPPPPAAEKRKAMEPEAAGDGPPADRAAVRRRLLPIGRLQHIAMAKGSADGAVGAPRRRGPKQRPPQRLAGGQRGLRRGVLEVPGLAAVLPSSTLQRVQAVLRSMQTNGNAAQYGAFPSFLCRP